MAVNTAVGGNANQIPLVSNKENIQNANEDIAKRLRYRSLEQFIDINEQMLGELGFDKSDLDEEKLLETHFYKEAKVATPQYKFTKEYDSIR